MRARGVTALVLALVCGALLSSCGYRTAQQITREAGAQTIGLSAESVAAEPGVLVHLDRGLDVEALRRGVTFVEPDEVLEPHRTAMLEVRVEAVRDAPVSAAYVTGEGGRDAVGATGHELRVELSATLLPPGAVEPRSFRATGRAPYSDAVLALATEQAREAALEQAMGDACDTLMTWLSAELMMEM